jgi:hypothetical protein
MPALLARLPVTAAATLLHTCRMGRPDLGALGFVRGIAGIVHEFGQRNPVSPALFQLVEELSRASQPLSQVEPRLPPMLESAD